MVCDLTNLFVFIDLFFAHSQPGFCLIKEKNTKQSSVTYHNSVLWQYLIILFRSYYFLFFYWLLYHTLWKCSIWLSIQFNSNVLFVFLRFVFFLFCTFQTRKNRKEFIVFIISYRIYIAFVTYYHDYGNFNAQKYTKFKQT